MTKDEKPKDDNQNADDFEYQFPSLHEGELEPQAPKPEEPRPADTEKAESAEPAGDTATASVAGSQRLAVLKNIVPWVSRHRRLALIIGFVVMIGLIWAIKTIPGGGEKGDGNPGATDVDEVPVNVVEVKMGRFQDKIETTGEIKGEAEIELRFEADGIIQKMDITEGQRVSAGAMIAQLNDNDAQLKVRRARIEVEQLEKLFHLGGVSKTKLDESRLNLEVAQAELRKTQLIAPRGGIIGDKAAEIGEFVNPQRKIATLVAIRNVMVKAGILEKDVDKVFPGQKVTVTVDAYPGNMFDGKIDSISPVISGQSRTAEVATKIPNDNSLLLPGMFARLKIVTYEADDALFIPNDALVKTQGGFEVYVVNKDNIAESREVAIGYTATEQSQIETGLAPGEIVVVQKPPELKSGSKIKIIEVQK